MNRKKSKLDFFFLGNNASLDFINTEIIRWDPVVELLSDFSDLVMWLLKAGLIDKDEADKAVRKWSGTPEGENALKQAREFRSYLRDEIVEKLIQKKSIHQESIDKMNQFLSRQSGHFQLTKTRDGFKTKFQSEYSEPIQLLGPVAESACDLISNSDSSLISKCENQTCMLYFYDTSKNHSRRWCSMNLCGNRMKVAAHYNRHLKEKRH